MASIEKADLADPLLTVWDVARITGLSTATLYTWRNRGGGPQGFTVAGRLRYRLSVVESWIATQEGSVA